jgi:hypothetical protein
VKADEMGAYHENLVAFLYLLLRDELTFGKIEAIMKDVEKSSNGKTKFSERTQERYARLLAKRLTGLS